MSNMETKGTEHTGENVMAPAPKRGHSLQAAYDKTLALHWIGSRSEEQIVSTMRGVLREIGPETQVQTIDDAAIRALKRKLKAEGLSAGTINRKLSGLSKILHDAFDLGWIDRVPRIPREREEEIRLRLLTEDEMSSMFSTLRHHGYEDAASLCEFLFETGMRVGEATNLRWSDWRKGLLHIASTKRRKAREIPLTGRCEKVLEDRKAFSGVGPYKGVTQSHLTYAWNRAKEELRWHDDSIIPNALRDTCAIRLLSLNVPIQSVQHWLGHKNIQDTMNRYGDYVVHDLENVRSLLDELER